MELKMSLIGWYEQHKRNLPWRETNDPYCIWLSEIILQQTRVDQGISYYYAFLNSFPNLGKLAAAPEQAVLKLWQGLGYYSRARNLLKTAVYIQTHLNGQFPDTYKGLLELKGIGPYTAAAIASFAFKLPHAVVDGNVDRVISRIYDIELPVNGTEGKKIIRELAESMLDRNRPDIYNQAIMELGALVCTPRNPSCSDCPVSHHCLSFERKTTDRRPVKIPSIKAKNRFIDYAVLETDHHFIVRKRTEKDIWQGLHDFAAIEGLEEPNENKLRAHIEKTLPDLKILQSPLVHQREYGHVLSHQKIKARFWKYKAAGDVSDNSIYLKVVKNEMNDLAVPRLIYNYLKDHSIIPESPTE